MNQPILTGKVTPPTNMVEAAKKTLGEEKYKEFVKQYPGEITPAKLVKFVEEHT